MASLIISPEELYGADKELKKEDVQIILEWLKKKPHLPDIGETIVALFLHSCYYRIEYTKTVIDYYYTKKSRFRDMFDRLDKDHIKNVMETGFACVLPRKTPENYSVLMIKLMDPRPEVFDLINVVKLVKMMICIDLLQNGFADGVVVLFDTKEISFGHLPKFNLIVLTHVIDLLKDGIPFRLKGFQFINVVPVLHKILALLKPFLGQELYSLIHLHSVGEDLYEYVPQECLPEEYDGKAPKLKDLQEKTLKNFVNNYEIFVWHDTQVVEESKRLEKCHSDLEGTFKKLQID